MQNNAENMTETLSELYKKTYGEAPYDFKFDEISQIELDGKSFVIGISRDKDLAYTDIGNKTPHARVECTTFLAQIKDGELTGDSIRIYAESQEECFNSESFNRNMLHMTTEQLLAPHEAYTMIMVDKNKAATLPRTRMLSDNSIVGNTLPDYITIANGFYNVADRSEIINAAASSDKPENYRNKKLNKILTAYCQEAIVPTNGDMTARAAETERQKAAKRDRERVKAIERMKALRQFSKENPSIFNNPLSKFARKIKAKQHIGKYRKTQREKAEKDLNFARDIHVLEQIIHGKQH